MTKSTKWTVIGLLTAVALTVAVILSVGIAFGVPQTCTFRFNNGEGQDAYDLHIEFRRTITAVANANPMTQVSGVGSRTIVITALKGQKVPKGGTQTADFTAEGLGADQDAEITKWWWTDANGARIGEAKYPRLYTKHLVTGTEVQSYCSNCHDLGSRITLDAHRTHKSPMFLAFYDKTSGPGMYDGCGRCHVATDILEASGAKLRRQVEPSDDTHYDRKVACLNCHGTGATTSTHLTKGVVDASGNILQPYGCLQNGCHMEGHPGIGTMAPVSAHSNCTWVSQPYTSARAYCTKCHGGLSLFATSESNPKP